MPVLEQAGIDADRETMRRIIPLIQERLKRLVDVPGLVDFFFVEELPDYDPAMLIPKKMTAAELHPLLAEARALLARVTPFTQDSLERSLRSLAGTKGVKAGQLFTPIRVAVCGRTVAPPLFGTLEVLGRERVLARVELALDKIALLAAHS